MVASVGASIAALQRQPGRRHHSCRAIDEVKLWVRRTGCVPFHLVRPREERWA